MARYPNTPESYDATLSEILSKTGTRPAWHSIQTGTYAVACGLDDHLTELPYEKYQHTPSERISQAVLFWLIDVMKISDFTDTGAHLRRYILDKRAGSIAVLGMTQQTYVFPGTIHGVYIDEMLVTDNLTDLGHAQREELDGVIRDLPIAIQAGQRDEPS